MQYIQDFIKWQDLHKSQQNKKWSMYETIWNSNHSYNNNKKRKTNPDLEHKIKKWCGGVQLQTRKDRFFISGSNIQGKIAGNIEKNINCWRMVAFRVLSIWRTVFHTVGQTYSKWEKWARETEILRIMLQFWHNTWENNANPYLL